jgi:GNAT superfamily N-acetyltransferase
MDVDIQLLGPAAARLPVMVAALAELVNDVYAYAERGLWRDGAARTKPADVEGFIRAGEVAVARTGAEPTGTIRIRQLEPGVGELGMLAVAASHQGAGIGRALVEFAEEVTRTRGLATMQLQLLLPRDWSHPTKEWLGAWYQRLGYVVVGRYPAGAGYPSLVALLATPCDFLVFRKAL